MNAGKGKSSRKPAAVPGSPQRCVPGIFPKGPGATQRTLLHGICLLFAGISIFASPFIYSEKQSGRYLLPVLHAADSQLFDQDPEVMALERFSSAFYASLASLFQHSNFGPETLEPLVKSLFIPTKIGLFLALLWASQALSKKTWAFLLIASWAVQTKTAPVGGDGLWQPTLTHATLAGVLGVAALASFLHRREFLFWAFLALAFPIHPLVSIHLAVIFGPILFFRSRSFGRSRLTGLFLLLASALLYGTFLAPPSFSTEEAELFLSLKAATAHISPFHQVDLAWTKLAVLLALAFLAQKRFLRQSRASRDLLLGSLLGSTLLILASLAAAGFDLSLMARLQPLRGFVWVLFAVFLIFAAAAAEALPRHRSWFVLYLSIFILIILNSLWWLAFAGAAILLHGVEDSRLLRLRAPALAQLLDRHRRNLPHIAWYCLFCTAAILFGLEEPAGLESIHEAEPLWALLPLAALPLLRRWPEPWRRASWTALLFLALGLAVILRSQNVYGLAANRQDISWERTRLWCRHQTDKGALFVTPPGTSGFRSLAWRRSLNESVGALAWVAPFEAMNNSAKSSRVRQLWGHDGNSTASLLELGRSLGAHYLIVDRPRLELELPLFQSGPYAVVAIPPAPEPGEPSEPK